MTDRFAGVVIGSAEWLDAVTDLSMLRQRRSVSMFRARLIFLSLMIVLSVGATLASSASATISFEWKVGGAGLKAGETKEFTVKNDGKIFTLHGSIAGLSALLLSGEVIVSPGSKLIGGVPGTGEATIVLKGVTVDKPANCGVTQSGVAGQIQGEPLKSEIVEGAVAGAGNGEVDVLFVPKTGTTLDTFELTGESCILKGSVGSVTGSFLGLPLPQKTEVLKQNLVFEAITHEYKNSAGTFAKAGVLFAGNPAAISGLGLVLLNSDQVYGPF